MVAGTPGKLFGDRAERATALTIAIYFTAFIAYAIAAQRGLVADGANYVVNIAAKHNFTFEEPGRRAAEILYQWPVVLAVRLGAQNLILLGRLYTAGCCYLVFMSLVGSWLLLPAAQKHLILFPILTILLGWMASCYDGMVEIHALVLWFWPTFFALLSRPLGRLRDVAFVFVLSIPMATLYPMVILLAPAMAGVALWRWRRSESDGYRWPWLVLTAWFVFVTANGARWILAPRVVPNRDSFLRALETLSFLAVPGQGVNWPLAFGLLSVPLLLICAWRPETLHRWLLLWLPPFLLLAVFTALSPVVSLSTFDPSLQVDARAWEGIAAALIVLVLFAHLGGWIRFREPGRSLALAIVAILAVAQITWHIAATAQWTGRLSLFRTVLASHTGLVPFEETPLGQQRIGMQAVAALDWPWTDPLLSIIFAPDGRVTTIVAAPKGYLGWKPFDPAQPGTLPQMPGIDYTGYLAALARAKTGGTTPALP